MQVCQCANFVQLFFPPTPSESKECEINLATGIRYERRQEVRSISSNYSVVIKYFKKITETSENVCCKTLPQMRISDEDIQENFATASWNPSVPWGRSVRVDQSVGWLQD